MMTEIKEKRSVKGLLIENEEQNARTDFLQKGGA